MNTNLIVGLNEILPKSVPCRRLFFNNSICVSSLNEEFFNVLAENLKLTPHYTVPLSNDTYHAIIPLVNQSKYDVGGEMYAHSWNRYKMVDFSLPVSRSIGCYFLQTPQKENQPFLLFRPFQWLVWVMIFISMTFCWMAFKLIEMPDRHSGDQSLKSRKNFFDPTDRHYVKPSLSILSTVWACSTLVLTNSYGSFLISQLLRKSSPMPFRDTGQLADLLLNSDYRLVTDYAETSSWAQVIEFGETETLKKMKLAIKRQPPLRVDNRSVVIQKVLENPKFIGVGGSFGTKYFMRNICNITIVEDTETDPRWMSLIFPKNRTGRLLVERFNQKIPDLVPFYEFLEKKYTTNTKFCEDDSVVNVQPNKDPKIPISLSALYDTFGIYVYGVCLSLSAFLVENISSCLMKSREEK